jgi:hypothetical protein
VASLTVVPIGETIRRPDAPADLDDEQAAEWRAIVDRLPADWFLRETHGMLAAYCRHIVSSRRVAELVARAQESEDLDIVVYDRLLKMQQRESLALATLATKMRISQQSTYDQSKKKPFKPFKKPWED